VDSSGLIPLHFALVRFRRIAAKRFDPNTAERKRPLFAALCF
jgi:hypothetical protein